MSRPRTSPSDKTRMAPAKYPALGVRAFPVRGHHQEQFTKRRDTFHGGPPVGLGQRSYRALSAALPCL